MEIVTEKNFQQPTKAPVVKVLKITNFTDETFTYTWNGIPYTFKPGEYRYMEAGIANHFAKHLINRELLKDGRENDTSPKKPWENPYFMALYDKCIEEVPMDGEMDDTAVRQEIIDREMKSKEAPKTQPKKEEEFEELLPPKDDEDEDQ